MKKIFAILFVLFFSLCCFAEGDGKIKFTVYKNNYYKYAVNEKILLIYKSNRAEEIDPTEINPNQGIFFFAKDYKEDSPSEMYREYNHLEYRNPPYAFYPDGGHGKLEDIDYTIPEIIGEVYIEESIINEIIANTFYWKFIREIPDEKDKERKEYCEEGKKMLREYILPNLNKSQLRVLRNTIYAYYGYRFASKDLQELFTKCAVYGMKWYQPVDNFDESVIAEPHREFINLIKEYEGKK